MQGWETKIHIPTWSRCAALVTKNYTGICPGERGGVIVLNDKYYRAVYEFHKKWSPFPATADDWGKAAAEAIQICKNYGNDKFIIDMLIAVYSDLERQYQAERGDGAK